MSPSLLLGLRAGRAVALPLLLLTLAASPLRLAAQGASGYRLARTIPVGGDGGWDYALVDGDRLYTSHATKLVVLDLRKEAVVGEVANTNGIHGVALATALGRGFTSNGRDTTVTIFDLKTLATLGTIKVTGANPDAIQFDAVTQRVFTFNGRGENATVIDATSGKVLATIPLRGKPEFAQSDGRGRLYVNIETDTGQIVIIDARAMKEVSRYWLPGCEEPSGLALDRANTRLFSVCGNSRMAVSDPATGKVVALLPIGPGVDAAAYDPETRLVFASNGGDGTLSVIRQESADSYALVENVATRRGSRTMALDPRTHRVYLAAAEFGAPPSASADGRPSRPPMIPGSFSILVVERK
jgi:hypothetical protein